MCPYHHHFCFHHLSDPYLRMKHIKRMDRIVQKTRSLPKRHKIQFSYGSAAGFLILVNLKCLLKFLLHRIYGNKTVIIKTYYQTFFVGKKIVLCCQTSDELSGHFRSLQCLLLRDLTVKSMLWFACTTIICLPDMFCLPMCVFRYLIPVPMIVYSSVHLS